MFFSSILDFYVLKRAQAVPSFNYRIFFFQFISAIFCPFAVVVSSLGLESSNVCTYQPQPQLRGSFPNN
jgi:hypothetical protein